MIFAQSNNRRRLLFAVAGVLLAWVVVSMVISPLIDAYQEMDDKIKSSKSDLVKITDLADKYITKSSQLPPALRTESTSAPILSTVEGISRRLGIEKNIERMTPGQNPKNKNEEQLGVVITSLPYAKFIDFLQGLHEYGSPVAVRRAKITTTFDNRNNVNAELTLIKAN